MDKIEILDSDKSDDTSLRPIASGSQSIKIFVNRPTGSGLKNYSKFWQKNLMLCASLFTWGQFHKAKTTKFVLQNAEIYMAFSMFNFIKALMPKFSQHIAKKRWRFKSSISLNKFGCIVIRYLFNLQRHL